MYKAFVNDSVEIELKEAPFLIVNKKMMHDKIIELFGNKPYTVTAKIPSFIGTLKMVYDGGRFDTCELIK